MIFRIDGVIPRYISVDDALNTLKAVLLAALMTGIVLFTFTRLDGIPRSVPAIHALLLGVGLVAVRGLARLFDRRRENAVAPPPVAAEHAIIVGLNHLSVFWIRYLDACAPVTQRVLGLLDPEPRWIGRSVHGVPVYGPPSHLAALIDEFRTHGVRIHRVLISDGSGVLPEPDLRTVRRVCAERQLDLRFFPDPIGAPATATHDKAAVAGSHPGCRYEAPASVAASAYFLRKGRIEFVVALGLLLALSPLWLIAALLAVLDLGSPIVFWQQRVGLHGRDFQLLKIRTLRPAFDRQGRKVPQERRLSWIGRLLRRTRLDELPQLLNVLVGDMSLVGPRPLLPEDQPPNPAVRLMVRPGITGWAQVNGGALLSPDEKAELDAWYVRNASVWLDLKIVAMTLSGFGRSDHRSEPALSQARGDRTAMPATPGGATHRGAARSGLAIDVEPDVSLARPL